jgi:hypothetical protein
VIPLDEEVQALDALSVDTSSASDIAFTIRQTVADTKPRAVHLDLQAGHSWWHTRLYLVAALAEDYERVGALVFKATRHGQVECFLGTASPNATRRALADVTPSLQVAYAAAHAAASSSLDDFDATGMIPSIFLAELSPSEPQLKIEVTEILLRKWLGKELVEESVAFPADPTAVTEHDLLAILDRRERYVALTRDERLVQVVDRQELANTLAIRALKLPR